MRRRGHPPRLARWTAGLLAIGLLAAALFAWLRPSDEGGGAPVAQAPPPAAPPARQALQARAPVPAPPAGADEPPLGVQVERLLASHAPEDAYRAYWLVANCASFNLSQDRVIFDPHDPKGWQQDALPGFRTMTEEEKRHDARLCSGLTERQRQSRLDYLAIAARAGVTGAAVSFATEGPFGDPSALQTRPGDPLVQAWKATALDQLTRAADSGTDANALQYLAGEYANGSALAERNPLLAYRYLAAMSMIDEELLGPADPSAKSLAARREDMADMVKAYPPDQRAAELAAARHIADLEKAQREQAARGARPGG